ncbi:MAG: agglutinin biogenesis protein MshI [Dehalococcoidia bacterium]|nr:agglutinin biogenesis protein MshI [Dehalococcoidia bacterium]
MRFFGARDTGTGLTCVQLVGDRVNVARVETRGRARPEIVLCESFQREADDATTLRRLRRELGLKRARCTTLLRPGEYQILQVDVPNVPPEEAKSAVRWRLKDLVDFPVEQAAVDAIFVPSTDAGGARAQMFAVAARREAVAAAIRPFDEADIPLEVIDIPELAQRNLAYWFEEPERALVLLALDAQGGLLTFTGSGELYLWRRIDIATRHFLAAGPEQKQALYERLVLELQRSLDHFDRLYRSLVVSRVLVALPGAEDLRDFLAANLDVPVAELDLARAIQPVEDPGIVLARKGADDLAHALRGQQRRKPLITAIFVTGEPGLHMFVIFNSAAVPHKIGRLPAHTIRTLLIPAADVAPHFPYQRDGLPAPST